jgi:hypothetical protein
MLPAAKSPIHKPSAIALIVAALIVAALVVVSTCGCRMFIDGSEHHSGSPLQPATPAPTSVSLEIYWARYPWGDEQLNTAVWDEVDENRIPAATRRMLGDNGFRVGVVGSIVPAAIARVLELEGASSDGNKLAESSSQQQRADMLAEPTVTRRRRQLQPGTRLELQASELRDHVPLLMFRDGELTGRTYSVAQALYGLTLEQQGDRSVRLRLIPEIHHGQPQLRYTPAGEGIIRQEPMRDHEVLADLAIEVPLAPGEMLLLAGSADASGRAGHFFHTVEGTDGLQQKLVIIRLAHVPESQAFAENGSNWPF